MAPRESVIAIIPARGGSKGLERKNIRALGGKPLIAWTIEAARACQRIDRVIVSTDDEEISEVSKSLGADVPFVRPTELAGDDVLSEPVLAHALDWLVTHEGHRYDIVVYLQATDPFRPAGIIDRVLEALLRNPDLDTVFAAHPDHKNYWREAGGRGVPLDDRGHPPRQSKPSVLREDTGIACATRAAVVLGGKRIGKKVQIIPYESNGHFVDIHTAFDLRLANLLIQELDIVPNS